MKIKKLILLCCMLCLVVLTGCEMQMPNPIIGSYVLSADSVGAPDYHLASLSLRADNTFTYTEVVTESDEMRSASGTYTMELRAYDFLKADGQLYLIVESIPEDVENFTLVAGYNPFLFDWSCDKNSGPKSFTLVRDESDVNKNFEFNYIGGPDLLPKNLIGGVV